MSKIKTDGLVKVNVYAVISRAVEEGARYGWKRAHKHTDVPSEESTIHEIEQAVMNSIAEVVDFGDGDEEAEGDND